MIPAQSECNMNMLRTTKVLRSRHKLAGKSALVPRRGKRQGGYGVRDRRTRVCVCVQIKGDDQEAMLILPRWYPRGPVRLTGAI